MKLIVNCIGWVNLKKTLNREALIKKVWPEKSMYYIWFLGVNPIYQNKGIGSKLLAELIEDSAAKQKSIYLETSVVKNVSWYERFCFETYHEMTLSYQLMFLRRKYQ